MIRSYISALTGSPDSTMSWRVIYDRDKETQGRNINGPLEQVYQELTAYNQAYWGIFANVNQMDGVGHKLENVSSIRAHFIDLDDITTSNASYQKAVNCQIPPHFAVQSSPNKYHLYWLVDPYQGNDFFTLQQKKLNQFFNADRNITDATRVLRVPGFYHCKNEPQFISCWGIHNNPRYTSAQIAEFLQHINIVEKISTRHPLGTQELAAESLPVLCKALSLMNPNEMTRDEWMSATAAFKQAGWSLSTEEELYNLWSQWCSQYKENDPNENRKLWNSIKDTELGWKTFERRTIISAYSLFGDKAEITPAPQKPPKQDDFSDLLDAQSMAQWFENCFFIESMGLMFTPTGRFMNSTQFNGSYGGKNFVLGSHGGKVTDEAWKAALRNTAWTVPKVDHIRFLPSRPPFAVIKDDLGRDGVNTYLPINVDAKQGDISLFLNHVEKILPHKQDRDILFSFMAHAVKFPGVKIRWSFLLQSAEGVGKSMFYLIMLHCLGSIYVHKPKASELTSSGSTFNAWLRNKTMIVVDEIKVDEKRELVEILKDLITDEKVEVQAKGVDQEMYDNPTNWLFFSNHKDAVPVTVNGRRYSVAYSALQTAKQISEAGINDIYLKNMFEWLNEKGGLQHIAYWLLNYPIEKGGLPTRAPFTTSQHEVIRITRTPMEVLLDDKIEANSSGFRNGFISLTAFQKAIAQTKFKSPPDYILKAALDARGYYEIGYTSYPVPGEDLERCSLIFSKDINASPDDYVLTK